MSVSPSSSLNPFTNIVLLQRVLLFAVPAAESGHTVARLSELRTVNSCTHETIDNYAHQLWHDRLAVAAMQPGGKVRKDLVKCLREGRWPFFLCGLLRFAGFMFVPPGHSASSGCNDGKNAADFDRLAPVATVAMFGFRDNFNAIDAIETAIELKYPNDPQLQIAIKKHYFDEPTGAMRKLPLMVAVECGRDDLVRRLLATGAVNPNRRCRLPPLYHEPNAPLLHVTPLHFAARRGNVQIVKALLEQPAHLRANPNCLIAIRAEHDKENEEDLVESQCTTPLRAALVACKGNIAAILVAHGAEFSRGSGDLEPTIHLATDCASVPLLSSILFGPNSPKVQQNEAAINARIDEVQKLNAAGQIPASIREQANALGRSGRTPLYHATRAEGAPSLWTMKFLFACGAGDTVNHRLPNGYTALYIAAISADVVKVKLLLQRGADPKTMTPSSEGFEDLGRNSCFTEGESIVSRVSALAQKFSRSENRCYTKFGVNPTPELQRMPTPKLPEGETMWLWEKYSAIRDLLGPSAGAAAAASSSAAGRKRK